MHLLCGSPQKLTSHSNRLLHVLPPYFGLHWHCPERYSIKNIGDKQVIQFKCQDIWWLSRQIPFSYSPLNLKTVADPWFSSRVGATPKIRHQLIIPSNFHENGMNENKDNWTWGTSKICLCTSATAKIFFPFEKYKSQFIFSYLHGIYEVTSSHCWDKDPCGSQLHAWHPALDCRFQCSGAQRSQRSPITFGRHGHCPVTLSQFPARLSQPYSLHSQPLTMVRKFLLVCLFQNL